MKKSELRQLIREEINKINLKEETFLDIIQKYNPDYSKEDVLARAKSEGYDEDIPGDYEDYLDYLKDVDEWFERMKKNSTVKKGDLVKVIMRSENNKWGIGKIIGEGMMAGSYMVHGRLEPNKVPTWEIECYGEQKRHKKSLEYNGKTYYLYGFTQYPKYEEGRYFIPLR